MNKIGNILATDFPCWITNLHEMSEWDKQREKAGTMNKITKIRKKKRYK